MKDAQRAATAAPGTLTVAEAAELVRVATEAVQDSRSEAVAGNQGQADTSAPNASKGSPWAAWEAEAAARREAHAAERAAKIAAGTYETEGLPIRMTLAETGGLAGRAAAAAEARPDGASAWNGVIEKMRKA